MPKVSLHETPKPGLNTAQRETAYSTLDGFNNCTGRISSSMGDQAMNIIHYLHLFIIRSGKPVLRWLLEMLIVAAAIALCWPITERLAHYCPIFLIC